MKKDNADPFNLVDVRKKSIGKDGLETKAGFLVVGCAKTEAEFVRCYGGDWRGREQKIIFENEKGEIED
jgi:hypothetical protein